MEDRIRQAGSWVDHFAPLLLARPRPVDNVIATIACEFTMIGRGGPDDAHDFGRGISSLLPKMTRSASGLSG